MYRESDDGNEKIRGWFDDLACHIRDRNKELEPDFVDAAWLQMTRGLKWPVYTRFQRPANRVIVYLITGNNLA